MPKMEKNEMGIIFCCLNNIEFFRKASKTMTPIPTQSMTMQQTYESLSKIFSSIGKDFEMIAKMAGLEWDLTTSQGEIILKKFNSLPDLNKTQRKKCMKEISTLLS